MYTVLIQNNNTMSTFHKYHPLFLGALKEDVGCCKWLESGKNIDTALPDLRRMIDDKQAWRAIIVRIQDTDETTSGKDRDDNPYVFSEEICDDVPLVRLTQILGGYPSPQVTYTEEENENVYGVKQVFYTSHKASEEEIRHYEEKSKEYDFDGKRPTEIILITFRKIDRNKYDGIKDVDWLSPNEQSSSVFWQKSGYPSICRYITYDYYGEGAVQLEEDLFKFWTSVFLLSINIIDPSSLQAYRLYRVNISINKQRLYEVLQDKALLMSELKNSVREDINAELRYRSESQERELSFYGDVPVAPLKDDKLDTAVSPTEFKVCPRSRERDSRKWLFRREQTEKNLETLIKSAERVLEETSDDVRIQSEDLLIDVAALDRLQEKDFVGNIAKDYSELIKNGYKLPGTKVRKRKSINEAAQKVTVANRGRLTVGIVFDIILLIIGVILISFLPTAILKISFGLGKISGGVLYSIYAAFFLLITIVIVLLIQKNKFDNKIRKYNDEIEDNVNDIRQNTDKYKEYVNGVVSLVRSRKYLHESRKLSDVQDKSILLLQNHLRAASYVQKRLADWAKAFYLDELSFESISYDGLFDTETPPDVNDLYSLANEKVKEIPLNESGVKIKSPVNFVEKLEIRREDLYDNE